MLHTLGTVSQFINELSGCSFITGSNQQRPWLIVGSWAMLLTTRDQFQREDDDGCREVTLAESTLYFIDYHTYAGDFGRMEVRDQEVSGCRFCVFICTFLGLDPKKLFM